MERRQRHPRLDGLPVAEEGAGLELLVLEQPQVLLEGGVGAAIVPPSQDLGERGPRGPLVAAGPHL